MEVTSWLTEHWFDLIQTVGIVGGLVLTARALSKDEKAQTVANMIAINNQYNEIWSTLYERPELARILEKNVDLRMRPVSPTETVFVKSLILHLDVVRRTMDAGIFIKIQGLQRDLRDFLELPIPKVVWAQIKPFQDEAFIKFVENGVHTAPSGNH